MATPSAIALRFQRQELDQKADLSPAGKACLANARGPQDLIAALSAADDSKDAINALAFMLPHRQVVWWACLGVRLLPDLARRPHDLAAVEQAEAWVQSAAPADAERAGELAEHCDLHTAPGWTAMAAFWGGPSLAPRGLQAVAPAPFLPGVAARTALLLLVHDPAVGGRLLNRDLLGIGLDLMNGDIGRKAQAAVRERLLSPA